MILFLNYKLLFYKNYLKTINTHCHCSWSSSMAPLQENKIILSQMQQAINKYCISAAVHVMLLSQIWFQLQTNYHIRSIGISLILISTLYRETGHRYIFLRSRANKYFGLLVIQYLGYFKGNNQRIKYRVFTKELSSFIHSSNCNKWD